jgi:class 3 adenylate cyclase/predicted ATPase
MQQIGDWLEKLGMSEYAQRFAENRIDFSVLPELTDQDLEKLGVVLGDRRKLLRVIRELDRTSPIGADASAPGAALATAAAAALTPPATESAGERRHVTVMFCDLMDSTGISAQLDAEEWRDLVKAYLDIASAAVVEMGGHLAKKLGDGILALFGYPVAHENDAECAVRAALSIQRALADLSRRNAGTGKSELKARVGLDTGPAVVDAAGEIYGDVANVAARVQTQAEPGAVLITSRVQRQVAGLFVAEERGSHQLKGVPEPVMLFRLIRASGGGRRAGQRQPTPLIGREEEMAMLLRRWERARQGDGQLVLIVGEPGVGKSRLMVELRVRLRETPHTWVEWCCSQLLQNTPLHPIAEWGRQRFGTAEMTPERRLSELENSLAQVKLDPAENVPLLAPLLEIPLPQDRARPLLAPEELRRRQLAALTNWVIAGARTQPVVLALEDLHWADPTTLDVLRGLAERGALAPVFVLATARPEFRPPWGMRSHHSTISPAPLDRAEVRDMVAELSARHALPQQVVEDVWARTGGVPLFVEEVTRLLLERGEQGSIQTIPPTLQQSLMARLDRLGPAREVAQVGAVIGRDFSYALLQAVTGMEASPLQAALEKLAEVDILLVQGLPPESVYRFKHALIQDAAYENLLKSRRQLLHRRVAEIFRDRFADTAAAEPEAIAHHFTQAGMTDAAIEWFGKAGQHSLERSALAEAVAQFTRALDQSETLPATPAQRREQIKLQVGLANALYHRKGLAVAETLAAFDRARAMIEQAEKLGEHLEDPLLLYSVLYGFFIAKFVDFDGDAASALARQFLALAEAQKATAPIMIGHRLLANTLLCMGEAVEGISHLDQALALYDPAAHRSLATRFGHDVGAATQTFRSFALWLLGYPDRALLEAGRARDAARRTDHLPTLLFALARTGLTHLCCRDYTAAATHFEECIALSQDIAPYMRSYAAIQRGCILAQTGKASDAVHVITAEAAGMRAVGATVWGTLWTSNLALAYGGLGKFDEAWRCIGEAMKVVKTTKERWYEAEINRVAGEIALRSPAPHGANAEEYFARALEIARTQQAKSWEVRAAMSMARLWRDQGKREEARNLLAPVYGWFTEGFDTLDLKEAKSLLVELAS